MTNDSIDDWIRSVEPTTGCRTCNHTKATVTIKALMTGIAKAGATHITLKQLHRKVCEMHPDYTVGYWGLRSHVRDHESDLYKQIWDKIE